MLRIDDRIAIPLSEFAFEFARSGGPGGQNVNKVASKATLRWTPSTSPSLPPAVRDRVVKAMASRLTTLGVLLITSQETRDQGRNVDACLEKVRLIVLAASKPPKIRRPTRPTHGSQVRRVDEKVKRGATKKLRGKPDFD